jgi:hypothetical protein
LFLFVFVFLFQHFFYGGQSPLCRRHANLNAVGQGAYGGRSPLCRRPGGLRGTESPVQEARGLTGDRVPCGGLTGVYPCEIRDFPGFTMPPEN